MAAALFITASPSGHVSSPSRSDLSHHRRLHSHGAHVIRAQLLYYAYRLRGNSTPVPPRLKSLNSEKRVAPCITSAPTNVAAPERASTPTLTTPPARQILMSPPPATEGERERMCVQSLNGFVPPLIYSTPSDYYQVHIALTSYDVSSSLSSTLV